MINLVLIESKNIEIQKEGVKLVAAKLKEASLLDG